MVKVTLKMDDYEIKFNQNFGKTLKRVDLFH